MAKSPYKGCYNIMLAVVRLTWRQNQKPLPKWMTPWLYTPCKDTGQDEGKLLCMYNAKLFSHYTYWILRLQITRQASEYKQVDDK